jgi:hypothetical protein
MVSEKRREAVEEAIKKLNILPMKWQNDLQQDLRNDWTGSFLSKYGRLLYFGVS